MSDANIGPPEEATEVKRLDVFMNEKRFVLEGSHQTGEKVKEAAIQQHVPIELNFELAIELGDGGTKLVEDHEEIEVHQHERFVAIPPKPIEIGVNENPVAVKGRRQTGLSIKEAAIEQRVPIQLDFVLSIELGGGRTKLVGDDEEIEVHEHERFLAIPNDDNS